MCQWRRTCQEEIISAEQKLQNYPLPLSLLHLMESSPTLHPAVDGWKPLHGFPLLVQSSAALFPETFESGRLLTCWREAGWKQYFLLLHPMAHIVSIVKLLIGWVYSCLYWGYNPLESCSTWLVHFIPAWESWTLYSFEEGKGSKSVWKRKHIDLHLSTFHDFSFFFSVWVPFGANVNTFSHKWSFRPNGLRNNH